MPGFKTFSATTFSSADVNSYLMQQTVIQCTSSTRPSSPHEGMVIVETDTDILRIYTGSAWVDVSDYGQFETFTNPSVNQGGTVPQSSAYVDWRRTGRKIEAWFEVVLSGISGSAGGQIIKVNLNLGSTLPSPRRTSAVCGTWFYYDASAARNYTGALFINAADSNLLLIRDDATAALGDTPVVAGTGDIVRGQLSYEASS